MRVFLDTNVLVSAFAARGICADLLEVVLLEHDLAIGRCVLRELDRALRQKVKLPADRTAEIIDFITGEAASVVEVAQPYRARIDDDDALVLGEAIQAGSHVFVTGDAALLKLATAGPIRILSPRQFWELLHTQSK